MCTILSIRHGSALTNLTMLQSLTKLHTDSFDADGSVHKRALSSQTLLCLTFADYLQLGLAPLVIQFLDM